MTERVLQSAGFLSRLRGRRAAPRGANPYASPPASESAISTGCIENMVSPSVSAM